LFPVRPDDGDVGDHGDVGDSWLAEPSSLWNYSPAFRNIIP